MMNQIRSEWIKLRSVRSSMIMLLLSLLLGVGVAALSALNTDDTNVEISGVLTGVQFATVIFTVLGVQIIGQEYRFNTIRTTFTATPRRGRVVTAKAVVLLVAVGVTSALLIAASIGAAAAISASKGYHLNLDNPSTPRLLIGTLAVSLLSAAFGYAMGCIARQPVAGIVIALVWSAVVEVTLSSLIKGSARWLPNLSASNLTAPTLDQAAFSPTVGGLYSATIIIALIFIGYVRISRLDA